MKDKALDKAFSYIDAIAQKLGVAAEHVYGIMVKQQIAEGITYASVSSLFFIGFIVAFIFATKKGIKSNWSELYVFLTIGSGIGLFFSLLAVGVNVPDGIMKIINPEYYAIQEILEVLKSE